MRASTRTLLITLLGLGFTAPAAALDEAAMLEIMQGEHRAPANVARDGFRHPIETLSFFGLEADMTVVEIWPGGGGWYLELLAPYLREHGSYTAAVFGPDSYSVRDNYRRYDETLQTKLDVGHAVYDAIELVPFWPPSGADIAPPESVDMVLTFRNLHNWLKGEYAEDALAAFHRALRPGGILAVVDHRADPRRPTDPMAAGGYVDEVFAIQLIQAAGFELVAASDVNDNPLDSSDHPAGVWTLPPSYNLGDTDREIYEAIGESDRFTLRFRKR